MVDPVQSIRGGDMACKFCYLQELKRYVCCTSKCWFQVQGVKKFVERDMQTFWKDCTIVRPCGITTVRFS